MWSQRVIIRSAALRCSAADSQQTFAATADGKGLDLVQRLATVVERADGI
jgi:hypothetical protein